MKVTLKNVPWSFRHGLIRRCCHFVLSQFLSPQKLDRLEIEIIGHKDLASKYSAVGFCQASDEHYGSGKRVPDWFTIEIDTSIDTMQFFSVLCHELVHVKQYTTSQLRENHYPRYRLMWKNKDVTNTYYSQSPHECEAYRKELKLLSKFIEWMDQNNLRF